MNFVRYGSDGSDFTSRVRLIKAVVEMLSEKEGKDWILSLKGLVSTYIRCLPRYLTPDSLKTISYPFAVVAYAYLAQHCDSIGC